ncbi:DUF4238 domain-containing protein [Marispirochaeta aestuarii]|uniref:DUF4238 domain-containing protein n=1 Tax=Marispirochaeta aestuarii TaxID=1963862 RepID=UPI002ABE7120|nr:DUF4238 domain-containing protein [Marispirochaeta aestuarii]
MKRRHHYVSRFLLNNFSNDGMINCFDNVEKTIKYISTKDAAVIRDYYRINVEGLPEDIFEDVFNEIEAPVAQIIRNINETKQLPTDDEEIQYLFLFIASLACRVPSIRENVNKNIGEIIRLLGLQTISHRYEDLTESVMRNDPSTKKYTKKELLEILSDKEKISIEIANEMQMENILFLLDIIYKALYERNWYIGYVADNKTCRLITTDTPILLYFTKKMPQFYSPAFLTPDTILSFAIDPQTIIYSELGKVPTFPISLKNYTIRENNYLSTKLAKKYYFYKENDFYMFDDQRRKITLQQYWSS